MAKTKTAKPEISTPASIPVPSIPAARVPDDTPALTPAPKLSAKDRLKKMGSAPVVEKPKANDRVRYDAPPEAVEALRRFIPAGIVENAAKKRADNAGEEFAKIMFKAFCETLWKTKVVPQNPKVLVRDAAGNPEMSAIFQVQDRFTPNNIHVPAFKPTAEEEEVTKLVVGALVDAGVEPADAEKLVTDEIDTQKRRNIRSLNELLFGHFGADKQWVEATPAEEAVATKLMDFLDTLTQEEQNLIRRDEMKITVKKSFLTRVCQYAHGPEQLRAILKVFEPTNFPSHGTIGLSDDEATKVIKLQQAANEIIGSMPMK